MATPRKGSSPGRRMAQWAGVAALGLLPGTGCQVEYGGMTLPSGKYMLDDVQYFTPGPEFPWANTQAATQRARVGALGDVSGTAPLVQPIGAGALDPSQVGGGRISDVNTQPPPVPAFAPPAPGGANAPGAFPPPQPGGGLGPGMP